MILKMNDISMFSTHSSLNDSTILKNHRFHNPSGVFFNRVLDKETSILLFFEVGAINTDKQIVDRKTFVGLTQKDFFEAVDYFESLIEERIPQEKPTLPSIGLFFYIKKMDSFVEIFDQKIIVDRRDISSVFTPPINKPFGRLDMTKTTSEKYELIRSKFALNYNEAKTNEFADKLKLTINDVAVYEMTVYSNSNDQNDSSPSNDINDDSLSLDKIEGEDARSMSGNTKESTDGKNTDKNEPFSNENKSVDAKSNPTDVAEPIGKELQQSDVQSKTNPAHNFEPSDEAEADKITDGIKRSQSKFSELSDDKIVKTLGVYYFSDENLLAKGFGGKNIRLKKQLEANSEQELKNGLYKLLKIDESVSKKEFINKIMKITEKSFDEQ